jgi:hypothetical protein
MTYNWRILRASSVSPAAVWQVHNATLMADEVSKPQDLASLSTCVHLSISWQNKTVSSILYYNKVYS